MSAGMAYEAMNNAGAMANRLLVILNDNDIENEQDLLNSRIDQVPDHDADAKESE